MTRLVVLLAPWVDANGGGDVLTQDNRLRIGNRRVRKPDLRVVLRRDEPHFERETLVSAPYLVVEVVTNTPRDEHRDRVEKLSDYEGVQARGYWLIDPSNDTLLVHELGSDQLYGPPKVYAADDRVDGASLGFPGLSFTPRQLGEER